MKKYTVLVIVLGTIVSLFVCFLFFNKEKTAYVDIKKIYEEFEMKKELAEKITKVQSVRNRILDSLEMELKILSQKINLKKTEEDVATFNVKREAFFSKKQLFQEDNQATIQDYDAKILKQLNQYIDDYGKQNNYVYILGYSGNGELLYADKRKNISDELILFINQKYKGVK